MKNIILIGMPGAGKSTIGVVLAKVAGAVFVDTDLLIQQQEGSLLQAIVDKIGCDNFITLESNFLAGFIPQGFSVIATGGSAVYTKIAMDNLSSIGKIVYLQLPYSEIEKRIHNITTRGLAMAKGKTLLDLYNVDRVSSKQLLDSLDKYDALIIVEPTQPFTETDKFIIDQYMMHNGNVMFLTDNISVNIDSLKTSPFTFAMPKDLNFADLLFNIGIRINANILLDNQCAKIPMNVANFGEQPRFAPVPWYYYPLLKPTTNHPITQNIDVVKAEFASTIDTLAGNGNLSKTVLLTSSAYSRIVPTPNTVGFNVLQNRPDKEFFNKYYIPTGVLIEGQANSLFLSRKSPIAEDDLPNRFTRKNISEQNRIIVVSDGDIIRNEIEVNNNDTMPKPLYYYKYFSFDQRTYMGNMDFLINAVNHLCGDSDLISIRSREITIRLLNKNRIVDEKKIWQVTNVVLPIIFIWLIGLVAYIIRKRKYSQTC